MQIGRSNSLSQADIETARRVMQEFKEVGEQVMNCDNVDGIDIDRSTPNFVKVDFSDLGNNDSRVKYTGEVKYDPDTKEMSTIFVTKNYDKKGGVGTNYSYHEVDENTATYWRDEMYQEFPMSRFIQSFTVDRKTDEIKNFEQWEERDDYMPPMGGESDAYNVYGA
jgi:hypothetical protein